MNSEFELLFIDLLSVLLIFLVNSQSKFHSRKGVELTMRNERNEDKEQERKGQKTKEKEQES